MDLRSGEIGKRMRVFVHLLRGSVRRLLCLNLSLGQPMPNWRARLGPPFHTRRKVEVTKESQLYGVPASPCEIFFCYNAFLIPILYLPLYMQTLRLMPCLLLIPFLKQRSQSLINARRERDKNLLPDFCPEKKWLVLVGHQKKDLKGRLKVSLFIFSKDIHILLACIRVPCLFYLSSALPQQQSQLTHRNYQIAPSKPL